MIVLVWPTTERLRTLRTKWRPRGSKAGVKGKVGEMLSGSGGVLGCCGKAGQLVESSWQRGRLVRRAEAGIRVDGDGGRWMSGSERWLQGGCGCCPCTRVTVAASERGGGQGGASAVEAGQSCSRHQGRHFL